MQPEDIIQQKSWSQLTDAEREIVLPLASTEQEYSLLKSILKEAVEDDENVPLISKSVQQRLHDEVIANKKKSPVRIYYYAAASVAILLFAAWFILKNNNVVKNNDTVDVIPKTITIPIDTASVNTNKPGDKTIVAVEKRKENGNSIKRKVVKQRSTTNDMSNQDLPPQLDVPLFSSTYINSDTAMLAMITEVY